MIEPIAGNMNFVRASVPFMQRLRELCTQHGALLVFDEVMTRLPRRARRRAVASTPQAIPGFEPDLSVFGKVIGGGMPLAAFGGTRAVMQQLAPLGPVYQAGTLSGNPVATACGLATLREIRTARLLRRARRRSTRALRRRPARSGAERPACRWSATAKAACSASSSPSELPQNYAAVMATDKERFNRFFHAMLDRGVYFAPALYEAGFVSAAHTPDDVRATVAARRRRLQALTRGRRRLRPATSAGRRSCRRRTGTRRAARLALLAASV